MNKKDLLFNRLFLSISTITYMAILILGYLHIDVSFLSTITDLLFIWAVVSMIASIIAYFMIKFEYRVYIYYYLSVALYLLICCILITLSVNYIISYVLLLICSIFLSLSYKKKLIILYANMFNSSLTFLMCYIILNYFN